MVEGLTDGLVLKREELAIAAIRPPTSGIERIKGSLSRLPGLESVEVDAERVVVSYYPELLSLGIIKKEIEKMGYGIADKKKKVSPFKRFVDRLAETNRSQFGSGPLDCCKLNNRYRGSQKG